MMHAMGLHSALAIKRQRKRREEQKRARERRYSTQSTESGLGESRSSVASPRASTGSLRRKRRSPRTADTQAATGIGMLHVGVVFLVLGLFLLGSAAIPDDFDTWAYRDRPRVYEFLFAGITSLLIGIFLIGINKIIAAKEERDLSDYVERQLTRSRSGHRLVRDTETGGLIAPRPPSSPVPPEPRSPPPIALSTPRSDLERILEEEITPDAKLVSERPVSNGRHHVPV